MENMNENAVVKEEKEVKNVILKFGKEVEKIVTMDEKIAKDWDKFISKNPKNESMLLTAALDLFMEQYRNNEIKIMIEL